MNPLDQESNASKKRKKAKRLVEKAREIQKSKKAAADKEGQRSLRRSSRSQVSVKKSYNEDEVYYSPNDISVKDCRFFLTWEKMFYSRSVCIVYSTIHAPLITTIVMLEMMHVLFNPPDYLVSCPFLQL